MGMVPFTGWYFAGVPITLEAEEICDGAEFLYWEVVSGDLVIGSDQDDLIEVELSGNVTIMAHFGVPVPPELISFDVTPSGTGSISLNGVALGPFPDEAELFDGDHDIVASPIEWWAFSHWSHEANAIGDLSDPTTSLFVDTGGTVVAHFEYVEHIGLTVEVKPAFAGVVKVVDRANVSDYWTDSFVVDGPQAFIASPGGDWKFSHWELQLYVPNAFSPNNDGVNDAFRPLGQAFGAQDYRFQVFNRWGEVVFSSVDPDEAWLGQDQRADGLHYVKDGSYAWSVQVRWTHGNYPEQFSGTLTVVR
jgi:gliding motility-associated-like protein